MSYYWDFFNPHRIIKVIRMEKRSELTNVFTYCYVSSANTISFDFFYRNYKPLTPKELEINGLDKCSEWNMYKTLVLQSLTKDEIIKLAQEYGLICQKNP